jgi:hypothetical protein
MDINECEKQTGIGAGLAEFGVLTRLGWMT